MKAVFLQVSHKVTSPSNPTLEYTQQAWQQYGLDIASEHFLELPTWVAEVSGYLNPSLWLKEFRILEDTPAKAAARIYDETGAGMIYFGSVLDVNRQYWHDLISSAGRWVTWVLGGYVNKDEFIEYPNVIWLDSPAALTFWFPGHTVTGRGPDYSLFEGYRCVPRLQLSTGCLYNCAFCTIERKVDTLPWTEVYAQVLSWAGLKFRYVYLDDKTFGQAANWVWAGPLGTAIKKLNPEFEGFIVQTTAHEVIEHAEDWVLNHWVRIIEVGVETLDPDTLKLWRKPHGVRHINQAAAEIRRLKDEGLDVWLVPNIIFGIEDHDYTATLEWLGENSDIISYINPYILCQYVESKGQVAGKRGEAAGDADETSWEKSWLTRDDIEAASRAMDDAFQIFFDRGA